MPGIAGDATQQSVQTAGMATSASKETIEASEQGIALLRGLLLFNLGLVAVQPVSAGFFLSGYARAVTLHTVGAQALLLGALIQAVVAVILWRRRRVPASMARFSVGLFVIVFVQIGLGYTKRYWVHVPLGVGMFGGLMRQAANLAGLRRTT